MSVVNVNSLRNIPFLKPVSRILLGAAVVVLTVLVVFWAAVHVLIVPRIDGWREDLEAVATEAVGATVKVGGLEAVDRGWWRAPVWVLNDVQVLNPQGQPALSLGRVEVAASLSSLLLRQGFDRLVVDSAHLQVKRSADDRWWVAGLDVTPQGQRDGKGLRWVLDQSELALRNGQVTWTDEFNQRPPVTMSDVQMVIRRSGPQHIATLALTPPSAWGQRWTFQADVRDSGWTAAPPERPWAHWAGTVKWDAPHLNAAPWAEQAAVWPGVPHAVKRLAGHGAVQVRVDLQAGRPILATAQLDWPEMSTQAHAQAPVLAMLDVKGLLRAEWAQGVSVSVEGLHVRTPAGLRVDAKQLAWRRATSKDGREMTDYLEAREVDARDLVALSRLWPLPSAWVQTLSRWEPAAQIDEFNAQWAWQLGETAAPVWTNQYQAKGRVRDVQALDRGAPGSPALPGLRGLSLSFALNQKGGQAQIDMANGVLSLPGMLDEAMVPVEALQGAVNWRMDGHAIEAEVRGLSLATPDWRGEVQALWRTAASDKLEDRWPGVLDMTVQLRDVDVARVHRYMPKAVPAGVRRYVKEGFVAGIAPNVSIRINGDLRDLPLGRSDAQGKFLLEADLQDVDFAYMPAYLHAATDPAWPRLQQAKTTLRFDGLSLQVGPIQANVQGAPSVLITDGQVGIVDLANGPAQLTVALNTQGPSPSFLRFINGSPLQKMTGEALVQAKAKGDVSGAFALQMRFADDPQLRFQGHAAMRDMDLRWAPNIPKAQGIQGRVDFSETGFTVVPTHARWLGEVFKIQGGTQVVPVGKPSHVAFDVQGRLSAQGLRQANLGAVSRVANAMTGSAAMNLRVGVRGGVPEVDLRSDLVGLALNLPAPMTKSADAALPLRVSSLVQSVQGKRVLSDRWQLSLGEGQDQRVGLDLRRELGQARPVVNGHAWVGRMEAVPPAVQAPGWTVDVRLPRLDVDAWLALTGAPPSALEQTRSRTSTSEAVDTAWWPSVVRLAAEELLVKRRELRGVQVLAHHDAPRWQLDVLAQEVEGKVALEFTPVGGLAQVYARLSRLVVPEAAKADVESLIAQPTAVPALDVVIEDLKLGGLNLGRIEVNASNFGEGVQQTWHLKQFQMTLPEATLSANGLWAATNAPNSAAQSKSTALLFQMDIRDAGALLQRAGHPGNLRGGRGAISGTAAWAGSPIRLDVASLAGQWQLRLEKGQVLKVDPGAGRLIGVLSLQSLPRRFLLDFRDTFVDGFAFDDFSGEVDVAQGVATSRHLRLRSVLADVHMDGQVDLVKRTQDIQLLIVPELNVGTASLALLAVNPVLGWSTFFAQLLLRTPLKAKVSQHMHVTGTWDQPTVSKVPSAAPQP